MDRLARRAEQNETADAILCEVDAVGDLGFDVYRGLDRVRSGCGFEEGRDRDEDA